MVISKLNNLINYPELKTINPIDKKTESSLYQINIHGVDIIIVIGHINNTFASQNVLYFPIYFVKHNNKVIQIGVYEIVMGDQLQYFDNLNVLKFNKFNKPLIYTFVNQEMLMSLRLIPDDDNSDNNSDNINNIDNNVNNSIIEIPNIRTDLFTQIPGIIPQKNMLNNETKELSENINKQYIPESNTIWLNKFFKNQYYNIIDNAGCGDCLFLTIQDAFLSIGHKTTVHDIRNKLSSVVTIDIFNNYKDIYDIYVNSLKDLTQNILIYSKKYKEINNLLTNTNNHQEQSALYTEGQQIKITHDELIKQKKITNNMLKDFKFMKNINTFEDFKQLITTSQFWGESWSISEIEKMMNIKFIILSQESYSIKDYNNILQCGENNISEDIFNPEYYIIIEYTGNHYRLVSYKDKVLFKFIEIPFDIKMMVTEKCLEKNSGSFSKIIEFNNFKNAQIGGDNKLSNVNTNNLLNNSNNLYDDNIHFVLNAQKNSFPGKGFHEKIPNIFMNDYIELSSLIDWRKKLTNEWESPFNLDGHTWTSIIHYIQASKFKTTNPSFYLDFSLDSNTELSKNVDMAFAAGNKSGKYKDTLIRSSDIHFDLNFKTKLPHLLLSSLTAKFEQNNDIQKILLLTKNAKLSQFDESLLIESAKIVNPPIILNELMEVRHKLINK